MVDALLVFILVELAAFLGFLMGVFYVRDQRNPRASARPPKR